VNKFIGLVVLICAFSVGFGSISGCKKETPKKDAEPAKGGDADKGKGKGDADKGKGDMDKGKGDMDKGKGDADKAKVDADKAKVDADKAKVDADKAKMDADADKAKADKKGGRQASIRPVLAMPEVAALEVMSSRGIRELSL
jgi:hypothetical protein